MTAPRVLFPDQLVAADLPRIGGKATGLYHLTRARLPVPAWCVITTDAFDERDAVLSGPLQGEIAAAVARLGAGPFAVRSSATVEDGHLASFSGQFDTVLDVDGAAAVCSAVAHVWASVDSPRARAALERAGSPSLAMAVIIQRQVRARWAGVLHTVNLAGERLDQVMVGVVRGAGEQLVSGAETGETWVLPPAARLTGDGPPLVDESALRPLVQLARLAEDYFGCPQDIELAHDGSDLHLLQSRPLTRSPGPFNTDPRARGDLALWDSSNIAESYAGPTSPLTFSFIRQQYANVYRETGETLGLDLADVRANEPYYQRLLGYFQGRIYYNLLSWYQLVLQLPGGEDNARHMEAMMGVKEPLPGATDRLPSRAKRVRYLFRLIGLYRGAPARVADFRTHFDAVYRTHRAALAAGESLFGLARVYRELERDLKARWAAPILADVFSMVFLGAVRALAKKFELDADGPITGELLAPREGSLATRPVVALEDIARRIKERDEWRRLFLELPARELVERLAADPALAPIQRALASYLEEYGDRFAGELKLEEPPLRDNPDWVVSLLKGHVSRTDDPQGRRDADRARAVQAETQALARLSGARRMLFRWALACARRFIGYRETMRYDRSRLFGLIRDLLRAMGQRLFTGGVLASPEDVYYLSVEEVLGFAEGTALTPDLAALAAIRRRQWDADRLAAPPPERFWTVAGAYAWTPLIPRVERPPATAEAELTGVPCYPGLVRATARVVHDPARAPDLTGQILVARSNDPGWVTLYPGIAGLLLERGSVLSHAANMAREMGIPAILGIPGLLDHVKDGDSIEMDAARGTLRHLPK